MLFPEDDVTLHFGIEREVREVAAHHGLKARRVWAAYVCTCASGLHASALPWAGTHLRPSQHLIARSEVHVLGPWDEQAVAP